LPLKKKRKNNYPSPGDYINRAIEEKKFLETGIHCHNGIAVYDEDILWQWIDHYNDHKIMRRNLFFEKLDKNRPTNRVPEIPGAIYFLKIKQNQMNQYPEVIDQLKALQEYASSLGSHKIKFLSHRDWNGIPLKYFVSIQPARRPISWFKLEPVCDLGYF